MALTVNITDDQGTLLEQVKITEGAGDPVKTAKEVADLLERNFECDLGEEPAPKA